MYCKGLGDCTAVYCKGMGECAAVYCKGLGECTAVYCKGLGECTARGWGRALWHFKGQPRHPPASPPRASQPLHTLSHQGQGRSPHSPASPCTP